MVRCRFSRSSLGQTIGPSAWWSWRLAINYPGLSAVRVNQLKFTCEQCFSFEAIPTAYITKSTDMARTGGQDMGMDMGATRTDWRWRTRCRQQAERGWLVIRIAVTCGRCWKEAPTVSERSKIKSFAGALDATDGHICTSSVSEPRSSRWRWAGHDDDHLHLRPQQALPAVSAAQPTA